jgi:diguanylate cyclase (GGDEF)-like protein
MLASKSLELFALNQQLKTLHAELEARVAARTCELEATRVSTLALLERDGLTGVCSRVRYCRELDAAFAEMSAGLRCVGLLLIDLDDFKKVNDTYGHSVGDDLLCAVATRLKGCARDEDIVARIGGDEFAVLLNAQDPDALETAVDGYHRAFEEPFVLDGMSLKCGASLGYAVAPRGATSSSDLQRFADFALYDVKNAGGGGVGLFHEDLRTAYEERRLLEHELILAIERDEIDICFQPIVNLVTGRIEALETLARWPGRKGRAVGPAEFIEMAEQSGLIIALSQQLLRKALTAARPWLEQGLIERLTFNISPLDLLHPGYVDRVLSVLAECEFPGERLVLEITEGVLLDDLETASNVIQALASEKVMFALDDFGRGYSNLLYLRHIPFAALKLDRSLVQGIASDGGAMAIVRNLVSLCNDLDIKAVCEGVETADQARILAQMSCEYAQGFLFPMPFLPSEADVILRRGKAALD